MEHPGKTGLVKYAKSRQNREQARIPGRSLAIEQHSTKNHDHNITANE